MTPNELIGVGSEHQQLPQEEHTRLLGLLVEENIITDEREPSPKKFDQNSMEPPELTASFKEM